MKDLRPNFQRKFPSGSVKKIADEEVFNEIPPQSGAELEYEGLVDQLIESSEFHSESPSVPQISQFEKWRKMYEKNNSKSIRNRGINE